MHTCANIVTILIYSGSAQTPIPKLTMQVHGAIEALPNFEGRSLKYKARKALFLCSCVVDCTVEQ